MACLCCLGSVESELKAFVAVDVGEDVDDDPPDKVKLGGRQR